MPDNEDIVAYYARAWNELLATAQARAFVGGTDTSTPDIGTINQRGEDMNMQGSDMVLIGGKAYRLRLEAAVDTDAFIKDRVEELTLPLVQQYLNDATAIANNEHRRILDEVRQNAVNINDADMLFPVVGMLGKAYLLRSLVYAPTRIIGMKMYWKDVLGDNHQVLRDIEGFDELPDSHYIECNAKPKHFMAMMVVKCGDRILTSRKIFHSMSPYVNRAEIFWHDMCIGNATAEQYWGVPFRDFVVNVNTINLESLGKHDIYFNDTPVTISNYINDLPYKVFNLKGQPPTWTT